MTESRRVALHWHVDMLVKNRVDWTRQTCDEIALGTDWKPEKLRALAERCRETDIWLEEIDVTTLYDDELRELSFRLELLTPAIWRERFDDFMRSDARP